jgi:hypothetical protein
MGSFKPPAHLMPKPTEEKSKAIFAWPKRHGKTAAMETCTSTVTNPCSEIGLGDSYPEIEERNRRIEEVAKLSELMRHGIDKKIMDEILTNAAWKSTPEPDPEPERGSLWGTW